MNRKIAFITEGFMGSALPLMRQLCLRGYDVDLYYYKREIHEPEACELDFVSPHYGINTVPAEAYKGIRAYISNEKLRIYTFSQMKPFASVPVLKSILVRILKHQARKAAEHISNQGYDAINMICNYDMAHMEDMLHFLRGNIIVSMHEVWNHSEPSPIPSPLLREAIDKKCKISVFSENSLKDISRIHGIDMNLVDMNPFGLFESFTSLSESELPEELPDKYILFFGYIKPYKGLGILHDAINILGESLGDYKIVIAGKGYDPVVGEIGKDDRYLLIHRFIHSLELVRLIRHAYVIVCPYLTMSQSGIPQTTFPFGTPIIASELDGFSEIITPDVGMLFPLGDAQALANCISDMIRHPDKRKEMHRNIGSFCQRHPRYDWKNICDKFLKIIANDHE
jgi:glycosyltransferase involved in cell wall biosynthesis